MVSPLQAIENPSHFKDGTLHSNGDEKHIANRTSISFYLSEEKDYMYLNQAKQGSATITDKNLYLIDSERLECLTIPHIQVKSMNYVKPWFATNHLEVLVKDGKILKIHFDAEMHKSFLALYSSVAK